MNPKNVRIEPPDLSHYEENRSKFPLDELAKYAGKHVAFTPDGTRILASADTWEELDVLLDAAGIPLSQAVHEYVEPPDEIWIF